jgi:hypothetical protein
VMVEEVPLTGLSFVDFHVGQLDGRRLKDCPGEMPQLATAIIGLLTGFLVPACCAIVLSPCASVT